MINLQSRRPVLQPIPTSFGGIVAPSGGDYSSIQDADDDLDSGPYTIYVKPGTYAGFTVATNDVYIMLGPGVTITSAIVLSGDNITLHVAPGCTFQGLLTTSGLNIHVTIENGLSGVGALMSGRFGYLNGGGFDSLMDGGIANPGIRMTGNDLIVENVSAQTTAGGGSGEDAIDISGARAVVAKARVVDSDDIGILLSGGGVEALLLGCNVLGADGNGVFSNGARLRAIGNYIFGAGGDGIHVGPTGDNSLIQYNVVQDQVGDSVELEAGGDNCAVIHNRLDGAVVDGAAGTLVSNNNTAAF